MYKNPNALSLGYQISDNYDELYKKGNRKNPFERLNSMVKAMSGTKEDILIPFDKEYLGDNKYKFNINTDSKYLYLSVDYDISINWTVYDTVYINDEYTLSLDSENIGLNKIENKYANSEINLRLESNKEDKDKVYLYYFDEEAFNRAMDTLKKHQLKSVKANGNKVVAKADLEEDGRIFMSIPYDTGWKIYVDNKKVKYQKTAGDFISFKVSRGKHNIRMKYYSKGFKAGVVIHLIGLSILVIYIKKKKSKTK